MFRILLLIHIAGGSAGLLLGPVAMFARKRRGLHTVVGGIYHALMAVVCLTASAMAVLHWSTAWYLLPIGIFSYGNAWIGYRAARAKRPGWLPKHIGGMLGSYIALVTALLVVNAGRLPGISSLPILTVWIAPTVIGGAIIRQV